VIFGGHELGETGATLRAGPGRIQAASRVAAVVLAAGTSSRMGADNKLLTVNAAGCHMIARVVDAVLASRAAPTLVVVGHQRERILAALAGRAVTSIVAPDYQHGLSASLRAGIAALPASSQAVLVCLGDMPLVTTAMIDQIIEAYDPGQGHCIVVPTYGAKRGNPVLWDRRFFAAMMAISGDTGARVLLLRHVESVREVALGSDAILRDFDTPAALAELT
jgi:molybdenum cofactor cytidylyltransferase